MTIGIFVGSFDPITLGHLSIIETAAKIFDKVIVVVAINNTKQAFIPTSDRIDLIKQSTAHIKNVEVDKSQGLTVDYAISKNATVLIRGLRNPSDAEYELQMSQVNYELANKITTILIPTKPEFSYISSSIVKDIFKNKGDISKFVPSAVNKYLQAL